MTQQQKPQEQMTQRKKGGTSGARTHNKENKGRNDATSETSTTETVDSKQPPNTQKSLQQNEGTYGSRTHVSVIAG